MSESGADQAHTLLAAYSRQRDNLLARIVGVLDADVRAFGLAQWLVWASYPLGQWG